jgi:hypothetical protein
MACTFFLSYPPTDYTVVATRTPEAPRASAMRSGEHETAPAFDAAIVTQNRSSGIF